MRGERDQRRGRDGEEVNIDPLWVVKKNLTERDLDCSIRLRLPGNQVENQLLPFLNPKDVYHEEGRNCDRIFLTWVKDLDTGTSHELTFTRWTRNGSYILGMNWISAFVERRNLRKGDMIGMFWDDSTRGFCFSVLKRSSPDHAAEPEVIAYLCKYARKHLRIGLPMPDDA